MTTTDEISVAHAPSASTSSRSSCSSRNTEPIAHGTARNRKLPIVEHLYIEPYKSIERRSLLSTLWYKLHVETSFMLLDPWERIVMYVVSIAAMAYSLSLAMGAFNWMNEIARAELV